MCTEAQSVERKKRLKIIRGPKGVVRSKKEGSLDCEAKHKRFLPFPFSLWFLPYIKGYNSFFEEGAEYVGVWTVCE